MLGFNMDAWDYITFGVLFLVISIIIGVILWLAGLPGRIAIKRKHPDAEAVGYLGWAGFLPIVPWIQAFIWAFKPTQIIDIRRYPKEEAIGIDEEIARLRHQPVSKTSTEIPPVENEDRSDKKENP